MIKIRGNVTSLSPSNSPTVLCLIAPDDTRVTIRPDPEDAGCEGRGFELTFWGVWGAGRGAFITVLLTSTDSGVSLTATA
jgi:hypothetical protein